MNTLDILKINALDMQQMNTLDILKTNTPHTPVTSQKLICLWHIERAHLDD